MLAQPTAHGAPPFFLVVHAVLCTPLHHSTAVAVAATHVLLLQVSQALEYTLWSAACESLFGFRMLNRAASVPAAAAVVFYHTPHPGLGPNLTKPAR